MNYDQKYFQIHMHFALNNINLLLQSNLVSVWCFNLARLRCIQRDFIVAAVVDGSTLTNAAGITSNTRTIVVFDGAS